jgi:hypothetical protein
MLGRPRAKLKSKWNGKYSKFRSFIMFCKVGGVGVRVRGWFPSSGTCAEVDIWKAEWYTTKIMIDASSQKVE